MIGFIKVTERGAAPRGMKRIINNSRKAAWLEVGKFFHAMLRDQRFTHEHGVKAAYYKRKGENLAVGSKAFLRSYTGRKFRKFGHTRPLEYSGETRFAVTMGTIRSTYKGGSVAYPGAAKFNFKHPKSQINMAFEFRYILPEEAGQMAVLHDLHLDKLINADKSTITTTLMS